MILPSKYIKINESIFGLGGVILEILGKKSMDVEELWQLYLDFAVKVHEDFTQRFDDFILALNYLYMIGAVCINKKGKIKNAAY